MGIRSFKYHAIVIPHFHARYPRNLVKRLAFWLLQIMTSAIGPAKKKDPVELLPKRKTAVALLVDGAFVAALLAISVPLLMRTFDRCATVALSASMQSSIIENTLGVHASPDRLEIDGLPTLPFGTSSSSTLFRGTEALSS